MVAIAIVIFVLTATLGGSDALMNYSALGSGLLPFIVAFIPIAWIGLAVSAKRLHDRGKSAWWLLVFWLLPSTLDRVGDRIEGVGVIFMLASIALSIWGLVEMGFLRGTVGSNRYGPDPLRAPS